MLAKVFSFIRVYDNSMIASVRIAKFIAAELGLPVCDDRTFNEEPLDVLIIINGAFAFCKCLEVLSKVIRHARYVVWVQNDYMIDMPKATNSEAVSPFRKAFQDRQSEGKSQPILWTAIKFEYSQRASMARGCSQSNQVLSQYINWSTLTLDTAVDNAVIAQRRNASNSSLLYYGSYRHTSGRRSRKIYFDRYFRAPQVSTVISSPSDKFKAEYGSNDLISCVGKFDNNFYDVIGRYGLGLYIADRMSHIEYHSTGNRFYEMLSAGLPMVFQPECGLNLRRDGYDVEPYTAHSTYDIQRKMMHREVIGAQQRAAWLAKAYEERAQTGRSLHTAWNNLLEKMT